MANRQAFSPFGGVYYHLYVPFFRDSNGDGIGDLRGVIEGLDYLNDGKGGGLGVKGIWLSPIHPSPHYHKYSVLDYYAVAPEYGTVADLEELTREAEKRGIRVLMDLVFNCTSDEHPAFRRACADHRSPEAKMYWLDGCKDAKYLDRTAEWNALKPWQTSENGTRYIGLYSSVMPDLDFNQPAVREACKKIAKFWLDKGVAGFRLDSAMHLYSVAEVEPGLSYHAKNIAWWDEFRDYCRSVRPDCYLVGEVWDTPAVRALYYRGLDSSFHFYLGSEIDEFLRGKLPAELFAKRLENAYLCASLADSRYTDSPFLSNHDMARFSDRLCRDEEKLKLAAAICLTLEGTPFVYYGEELGMRGEPDDFCPAYAADDEFGRARTAFDWGDSRVTCAERFRRGYASKSLEEQKKDPASLYCFYRRTIALRNACRPLSYGRWAPLPVPDRGILAYEMRYGEERVALFHNATKREYTLPAKYENCLCVDLMDGAEKTTVKNKRTLPPLHSALVYCL